MQRWNMLFKIVSLQTLLFYLTYDNYSFSFYLPSVALTTDRYLGLVCDFEASWHSIWTHLPFYYNRSGVNFINFLRAAFLRSDPESIRFQLSWQYHFLHMGSTYTKAASRNLMKLSPGVNFSK